MKLGGSDIVNVQLGSTQVNKVYQGSNLVWEYVPPNPLLDDYPNAAAAYSLRLLRSAYTGSAIEVRNDSGTHLDIGFVDNELDTATLLTHCGSGNGTVSKWYDQSGNGNDATQSTVASQPKIVSSGSVIIENGKACIDFDGIDDILITSYGTSAGNDFYVAWVMNTDVSRNNYIFSSSSGFSGGVTFIEDNDFYYWTSSEYALEQNLPSNWNGLGQGLLSINKNGNSVNLYAQQNNYVKTISNPNNAKFDAYYLSTTNTSRALQTNLQEIIIYPSDQSSNRTGIETNINDFYSIY